MDTLVGIYKSKVIWVWRNLLSFVPGRWLLPGPARLNVILQSQQSITWLNVELTVPNCRIDKNFSTHLYRPWHKIFFCLFWWYLHIRKELGLVTSLVVFVWPNDDPLIWGWLSNVALRGLIGSSMSFSSGPLNQIFPWWRPPHNFISLSEFPIPHIYSTHHSSSKSSLKDGQQSCYSQLCV